MEDKVAISVYNPSDPVEAAFQDAYHASSGRTLTMGDLKAIKRCLSTYRGLANKVGRSPERVATMLFAERNQANLWYYPCDVVELRTVLGDGSLAWHAPILLFSQKAATRLMPEYPLCLVFDHSVAKEGRTLGGLHLRHSNRLDLKASLKRVMIRDYLNEKQANAVYRILKETMGFVPTYLMTQLPGIDGEQKKVASSLTKEARQMNLGPHLDSAIAAASEEVTQFLQKWFASQSLKDGGIYIPYRTAIPVNWEELIRLYPVIEKSPSGRWRPEQMPLSIGVRPSKQAKGVHATGEFDGSKLTVTVHSPTRLRTQKDLTLLKSSLVTNLRHEVTHMVRRAMGLEGPPKPYIQQNQGFARYVTQPAERENWLSDFDQLLNSGVATLQSPHTVNALLNTVASFASYPDREQRQKAIRRCFLSLSNAEGRYVKPPERAAFQRVKSVLLPAMQKQFDAAIAAAQEHKFLPQSQPSQPEGKMAINWFTRMKVAGPAETFDKTFLIGEQPKIPDEDEVQTHYELPHRAMSLKKGDRVAFRYDVINLGDQADTKSVPVQRSLINPPKTGVIELIDRDHIHVKWDGAKDAQKVPVKFEMFLVRVGD